MAPESIAAGLTLGAQETAAHSGAWPAGLAVVSAFIAKETSGNAPGLNSTRRAWSRVMHLDTSLPSGGVHQGFRDLNGEEDRESWNTCKHPPVCHRICLTIPRLERPQGLLPQLP